MLELNLFKLATSLMFFPINLLPEHSEEKKKGVNLNYNPNICIQKNKKMIQ